MRTYQGNLLLFGKNTGCQIELISGNNSFNRIETRLQTVIERRYKCNVYIKWACTNSNKIHEANHQGH